MKCDFCRKEIFEKNDDEYYMLDVTQCNIMYDKQDSYDFWIACKKCFSKIEKFWKRLARER